MPQIHNINNYTVHIYELYVRYAHTHIFAYILHVPHLLREKILSGNCNKRMSTSPAPNYYLPLHPPTRQFPLLGIDHRTNCTITTYYDTRYIHCLTHAYGVHTELCMTRVTCKSNCTVHMAPLCVPCLTMPYDAQNCETSCCTTTQHTILHSTPYCTPPTPGSMDHTLQCTEAPCMQSFAQKAC